MASVGTLVLGLLMDTVVTFFSIVYPAYYTYKALKNKAQPMRLVWLKYWVAFAAFHSTTLVTDILLSWLPFYDLGKLLILLWLVSMKASGAQIVYTYGLEPFIRTNEKEIDRCIKNKQKQLADLFWSVMSRFGANYAAIVFNFGKHYVNFMLNHENSNGRVLNIGDNGGEGDDGGESTETDDRTSNVMSSRAMTLPDTNNRRQLSSSNGVSSLMTNSSSGNGSEGRTSSKSNDVQEPTAYVTSFRAISKRVAADHNGSTNCKKEAPTTSTRDCFSSEEDALSEGLQDMENQELLTNGRMAYNSSRLMHETNIFPATNLNETSTGSTTISKDKQQGRQSGRSFLQGGEKQRASRKQVSSPTRRRKPKRGLIASDEEDD